MILLVIGASASGKSDFAEKKAVELSDGKNLYYLATMKNNGSEAEKRITKHICNRSGKGFLTIEKIENIGETHFESDATVLLEDVSNLLANEMFSTKNISYMFKEGTDNADEINRVGRETTLKISKDIENLAKRVKNLVVVSNDIFQEEEMGDLASMVYIKSLGEINSHIKKIADKSYEIVCGLPVIFE